MLDVVSLVNFDVEKRATYLDRSFKSFYAHNPELKVRHLVFDGSKRLDAQMPYYKKFGVEVIHCPGMTYGQRLKKAMNHVQSDYFLFYPDDFHWIMKFPIEEALMQCRRSNVAELKLVCRGMSWFSKPGGSPEPWHDGAKVMSGEVLTQEGDLFLTRRRFFRDGHEKFSLGCHLIQTKFAQKLFRRIRASAQSPSKAEIEAYLWLALSNYCVAYYKMWIPAFHFIDLTVEANTPKNLAMAEHCLVPENFEAYNRAFNR